GSEGGEARQLAFPTPINGVDILRRVARWGEAHDGVLHCVLRGAMPEPPRRRFTPLDIRAHANVDFRGEGAEGVPGWTGEGPNDLHQVPVGRQTFCDIRFRVPDPAANGRRGCIGLWARPGYALQRRVPVGRKTASLYLLHTSAGRGVVGTLTLRYADGSSHTRYVMHGRDVAGWWTPHDLPYDRRGKPVCKAAWRGENAVFKNVGVYAFGLDNPHPEKEIAEVVLDASANGAFWAVLGITLCDREVFFVPDDVSHGIPDVWGAAAITAALIEGLAGIQDAGVAYDRARVAPRWAAAGVRRAAVSAKYEASGGYVRYICRHDARRDRMVVEFTGSGSAFELQVLLPEGREAKAVVLDAQEGPVRTRRVEGSLYACVEARGLGAHRAEIELAGPGPAR
ncbi:MAG: hypothetical protein ACLF0G_17185, partial [Candidatus Brocadiia bacterium]